VERARTEGKDRRESRIKAKSNPALLTGRADAKAVGDADRAAIHRSHSGQAPGRPGITYVLPRSETPTGLNSFFP
jgi:hypothetical protein